MLYREMPEDFNSSMEAVGCFMGYGGEILLLQRQENRSRGNLWGFPSGEIDDEDGSPLLAMIRETREETGFETSPKMFGILPTVYIRYPEKDFVYHMFSLALNEKINVILSEEHKDYRWVSPREALSFPLRPDTDSCIELVYGI